MHRDGVTDVPRGPVAQLVRAKDAGRVLPGALLGVSGLYKENGRGCFMQREAVVGGGDKRGGDEETAGGRDGAQKAMPRGVQAKRDGRGPGAVDEGEAGGVVGHGLQGGVHGGRGEVA